MFLFACCQIGAETVLKREISLRFPQLRLSFSRPGFLTFKIHKSNVDWFEALKLSREIREHSVFSRFVGVSLGKIVFERDTPHHEHPSEDSLLAGEIAGLLKEKRDRGNFPLEKIRRIHFWRRDMQKVGEKGYEPIPSHEDTLVFERLVNGLSPETLRLSLGAERHEFPAQTGQWTLDCVHVDTNVFWIGFHKVTDVHSKFPGGLILSRVPNDMISRAWLKFEEALRWSGFPIRCGTSCLDIGCAPGGASQVLLNRGAQVIGVDPAERDSRISGYPNFTFLRGRIGQIKRKHFRNVKYAISDMNVAPSFTLEVLEELVNHRDIRIRGLLFTLKLFQWELAETLSESVQRIKSWGYEDVRVRQLQFNRQEVMVAAKKRGQPPHDL